MFYILYSDTVKSLRSDYTCFVCSLIFAYAFIINLLPVILCLQKYLQTFEHTTSDEKICNIIRNISGMFQFLLSIILAHTTRWCYAFHSLKFTALHNRSLSLIFLRKHVNEKSFYWVRVHQLSYKVLRIPVLICESQQRHSAAV